MGQNDIDGTFSVFFFTQNHRMNGDAKAGKEHYTELLKRCEDCFEWSGEGDVGLNAEDVELCKQRDLMLWLMEIHQLSTDEVISKYLDYKIDIQVRLTSASTGRASGRGCPNATPPILVLSLSNSWSMGKNLFEF